MASNSRDVEMHFRVLTEGVESVDKLEAELAALAATTKSYRAAETASAAEVMQGKRALDEQRDALARLRVTYAQTGGDASKYKSDVAALRIAILDSRAALRAKQDALTSASNAARTAAAAEQQLAAQVKAAGDASRKAAADIATVGKSATDAAGMLRSLGPMIAGAFSAQQFLTTIASAESLRRAFGQVFESATTTAEEFEYVKATANRLGIENLQLAKSYLSIAAATKGSNLAGEQTRAVFEAIVRAMSTLGKSTAETERALTAVSQIATKGTVAMEELRGQLGESLPGALQAAAKGAGVTVEQLVDLVSQGKVLASDILPALTKGLNDLYANAPPPDTLISNWARLKNVFTDTASALGEGGASKGLTKVMSGAALAAQGFSAVVDILGTGVGEAAAAIATGNFHISAGEALTLKYAETLRKTSEAAGFVEKAQTGMNAAQLQGNQTAAEAFRLLERVADKQQQVGESMLALKVRYADLAKGSADYIAQLEREVSARGAESAALVQLVNVYGTEAEKREVLAEVAQRQFAISQRLAQAKETEAIIAASLSLRLQEEARNRGDNTEATRKEIEEAKKNAQAKNTEAEQSKASAISKRIETEATKANALAYQDNSARVYEFRAAAAEASREVERLTALQKVGKATDDQVAEARAKAAAATRLYRDALSDATEAAQRRVTTEQQLAQAAQAAIGLEMERARAAREVATANGDAAKLGAIMRQESALQVRAYQEEADAARRVAQAIREATDRKEQELRATGELTAAKREEIEAARRSADMKEIEAQRADILADKTRRLADSESARTTVLEKQLEVQEKALQLAERQRALEERKRTAFDTAGNVVNAQSETLTSIMNTLKGYGLSDDAARREAQKFINPNGEVNYGAGNSMGGSSLSDTLRIIAERAKGGGQPVGSAQPAPGGSRTVNINIGGRQTAVNVASQKDSDNLVGLLRQLENQQGTAA